MKSDSAAPAAASDAAAAAAAAAQKPPAAAPGSVQQNLRKLGETTSVRGVPRILKSTDTFLLILWIVAVLACAGILIWQLTVLFIRYFSYEYSTVFKEGNKRPVFPTITICNTYPLGLLNDQSLTYDQYLQNLEANQVAWPFQRYKEAFQKDEYFIDDKNLYDYLWTVLSTTSSYFASLQSVPDSTNPQQLIVSCDLFDWDWTYNGTCSGENIKTRWDPSYYKCYEISVPPGSKPRALTAIIYLNDFTTSTAINKAFNDPTLSVSSGIRVAVAEAGKIPDMKLGVGIGPGVEANTVVSATQRQRLSQPWANCTSQQYLGSPEDKELYSYDACLAICQQEQVIADCGCVFGQLAFTQRQLRAVNYRFCANQTWPNNGSFQVNSGEHDLDGLRDVICVYIVEVPTSCQSNCQFPCNEYIYDLTTSTSGPWPSAAYQLAFYASNIQGYGLPNGDQFDAVYQPITAAVDNKSISLKEAYDRVSEQDLITRNFIQLNVLFDELVPFNVNDKASLPPEAMLAQVGGTLNLWLGMTVVVAIELIEFVYNLVRSGKCRKQKTPDELADNGQPPHAVSTQL